MLHVRSYRMQLNPAAPQTFHTGERYIGCELWNYLENPTGQMPCTGNWFQENLVGIAGLWIGGLVEMHTNK